MNKKPIDDYLQDAKDLLDGLYLIKGESKDDKEIIEALKRPAKTLLILMEELKKLKQELNKTR